MKTLTRNAFTSLLIVVLFSTWAHARPGYVKVQLEVPSGGPAGSPPAEVLARLGAMPLRTYPAFSVISVPEGRREEIETVARGVGLQATIHEDWDRVYLPGGFTVDTRSPRLPASGVLNGYPGGEGLYVLQFEAPLDAEWTGEIEQTGLTYVSYLPYNTVLVYGHQNAVAKLAARPYVQWASLYHPAFRARPADLAANDIAGRYVVQFVDTPGSQTAVEELLRESRGEVQVITFGPYVNVTVEVDPEILRRLIAAPGVVAIERAPAPMLSGEREAIAATGGMISTTEPYQDGIQPYKPAGDYRSWLANRRSTLPGLLGNQMIAVADTGFAGGNTHPAPQDFTNTMISGKYYCGGDSTVYLDSAGHGTLVAGFAAGNPTSSPSLDLKGTQYFHHGMGLAPGARLFAQRITTSGATFCGGISTWAQDALNERALRGSFSVVQNHSHNDYGVFLVNGFCTQVSDGLYTLESQQYDYAVRDRNLPITVSVGNVCQFDLNRDPSCKTSLPRPCPSRVLPPATAKNVLSVGASESYRPGMAPPCDHNTTSNRQAEDYWASTFKRVAFVSRQGTVDGRIKPDIVAPVTMASSTIRTDTLEPACKKPDPNLPGNQGINRLYSIDTGTSWAAPQAAGAMAVVNAWRQSSSLPALSPAGLKSVLVGSSVSLKGGINDLWNSTINARPNAVQGFGRLNLAMALTSVPSQGVLDEASWPSFTGAGQLTSRIFTVSDRSKPAVVVLAWSDEPAVVQASPTLVRNLNLEVFLDDGCTIYVGNRLHSTTEYSLPGSSCGAKKAPDINNNVEIIVIPPNMTTTFSVWVTAATWGGTTSQKFAVYYYNATP